MKNEVQFSLAEMMERFATEEACEKELYRQKWRNGFVCPRCGHGKHYTTYNRRLPLYKCASCRHQTTSTVGTVMQKSTTPLRKWFLAIFMLACDKRGVSAKQLQRELKVAYQTAWSISHKIKDAINAMDTDRLGGIVQLDDIYIGGKKSGGKRGRGTKKEKVLIAVSVDEKGKPMQVRLRQVPNLRRKTITRFVETHIHKGSTARTDKFRTYRLPEGYYHESEQSDPTTERLRWLHVITSNLKAYIQGTFHGLDPLHLQRYLDEYAYRFDRRYQRGNQFFSLLSLCATSPVATYGELVG